MDKSFMTAAVSSLKMLIIFLEKDRNLKGLAQMQNFYNSGK